MINKNLLTSKKADLTGVLYFVCMIAAFAIFILIVGYVAKTLGTEMISQIDAGDAYNETVHGAFQQTINVSTHTLPALWYVIFGGLLIGLIITAWMIPTHPVFAVPFLILLAVAIIVGVAMSNAYNEMISVAALAETAAEQSNVGWIIDKLPYVALIVGLLALVITFAKPGAGGGQAAPTM